MQADPVLKLLGAVFGLLCPLACIAPWLALGFYLSFKWQAETDKTYQLLLKKWADENGWDIVHRRRCKFLSPWIFSRSGSQFVYYVTVAREDNPTWARWAWVRCGGWFLGPKSDRIEVSWDGRWHRLTPPEPTPTITSQDDLLWDPWLDG
jgi:hypothetical protein